MRSVKIDGNLLCCPSCGDNYLQHDSVTVYDLDNPESPRDGVRIRFICQHCGEHQLTVDKYKGCTRLAWA